MRNRFRSLGVCLLLSSLFSLAGLATAAEHRGKSAVALAKEQPRLAAWI